jgi:predicted DNA-binding transcriptional regulator AlpA
MTDTILDPYLSTAAAAKLAGYSPSYFRALRASGTGPRSFRPTPTGAVRYRASDVISWCEGTSGPEAHQEAQ